MVSSQAPLVLLANSMKLFAHNVVKQQWSPLSPARIVLYIVVTVFSLYAPLSLAVTRVVAIAATAVVASVVVAVNSMIAGSMLLKCNMLFVRKRVV
jgi:hypothetical protein